MSAGGVGFHRVSGVQNIRTSAVRLGLVLPGGGARAAYQVGVLRAVADLLPPRAVNPFPIISGTSAGAINATEIACNAHRYRVAVAVLDRVWRNFHVDQVFRADTLSMARAGLHWLLAVLSGGLLLPPPRSLFDNTPLRELLAANLQLEAIRRSLELGHLESLAISAAGYTSARSTSFFESSTGMDAWTRVRRAGKPGRIDLDHLMASVAVPFLFPPVRMGWEYFGDGSMRQATPFSAAIHLGADRLLVVGTRDETRPAREPPPVPPTFGQIFGYMLDALFMDGLYSDLERLSQINRIVEQAGDKPIVGEHGPLRRIEIMLILPSRDPSEIARSHARELPRQIRVLLRTMGAFNPAGGQLMSYLMFEGAYTRELMALGYHDAMGRADELQSFLRGERHPSTGATGTLRKLSLEQEEGAEAEQ